MVASARGAVVIAAVVMLLGTAVRASAHPLHTTLTELTVDADRSLQLSIRVFIDDFSAAVARKAGRPAPADYVVSNAEILSYLSGAVAVRDGRGRSLALELTGTRRANEVLWISMHAKGVANLRGLSLRNGILFEVFDDQVNIVRAREGNRRESLLFTKGDGFKAIP